MTTPDRIGLISTHGRALIEIALASGLGIIATAGFQIAATRGLGPSSFGLLAAFLALINIAAIGSSALRNSVAVGVAEARLITVGAKRRVDPSLVEALVLGIACAVGLVIAAPWLASSVGSNPIALVLTIATVTPYFLFARSQGLLQGAGNARAVVWWSTGAQLLQLVLTIVALLLGYDAIAILVVYLVTVVLGTVGAGLHSRSLVAASARRPFSRNATVVLLLTLAFAWLTNVDVILVRIGAPELVAGSFAAAAVLVKTTLILPAMLSLYLLPRFVKNRGNLALTRLGVNLTLAVTLAGGLVIFAVLAVGGGFIVPLLFGSDYALTIGYLPGLALMWLPWAMTQAILVRVTSLASVPGLLVLLAVGIAQWIGAMALLPDISAMMVLNGSLGVLIFVALFVIHQLAASRDAKAAQDAGDVS